MNVQAAVTLAVMVGVFQLAAGPKGRLREGPAGQGDHTTQESAGFSRCAQIRVLHVEGALFYGSAGELQSALDAHTGST